MRRKVIFILTLFFTLLNATTLQTLKDTYTPQETITLTANGMQGSDTDWIGIYTVGSSNDWGNVIGWNWTGGIVNGNINLEGLPNGEYEARAFFSNTFNLEATTQFSVQGQGTSVSTTKESYIENEILTVNYAQMSGNIYDWVGIYPAGSVSNWANLLGWKYIGGAVEGSVSFDLALPAGNYSARVFFNNSYAMEASHSFTINAEDDGAVTLSSVSEYNPYDLIHVSFNNMAGNATDWIGIYPAGASYEFENVIKWRYLGGKESGELTLNGLPAGEYDIRAFFNNSLTKQATKTITVLDKVATFTMYEDAEDGISPNWVHVAGKYDMSRITPGFDSLGAVRFMAYWLNNGTYNPTEFRLPLNNNFEKFLEIDMRANDNPHFNFTLLVETKNGERLVIWDSFFNHNGNNHSVMDPFMIEKNGNVILNNPAPDDYHFFGSRLIFRHYKINVEETIRLLEPDNELIRIDAFITTGGEYDNIKLSSH